MRQARLDAEAGRRAALAEYNQRTKAITETWKSGFAALKSENDRMQKERDDWYKEKKGEIGQLEEERIADCAELQQ